MLNEESFNMNDYDEESIAIGMESKYCMALIKRFKIEQAKQDRGGIYGETQRSMAYNSNKIEGSTLTEDQTATLFESRYLPTSDEPYRAKDIEEMTGHFLMFNKMLETIESPLTQQLIKDFHYALKAGVFEDRANGYAIGEYKKRKNTVARLNTAAPEKVEERMAALLREYSARDKNIETMAWFHAQYELIHPFQDGNGRTGRMILYRECLKNNLIPVIVHSDNEIRYKSALNKAQTSNDYAGLILYFRDEQARYRKMCDEYDILED